LNYFEDKSDTPGGWKRQSPASAIVAILPRLIIRPACGKWCDHRRSDDNRLFDYLIVSAIVYVLFHLCGEKRNH
jgi:hypothetical protein